MKAQVQIVQFLLFFLLGLLIFYAVNSFLLYQNTTTQNYLSNYYLETISSYISTSFTDVIVYCKSCNFSSVKFSVPTKILGRSYEINFNLLFVKDLFLNEVFPINSHNLNTTYYFEGDIISSQSSVIIQFNKTQNKIKIL